jgi:hypothetical protein
MSYRIAAATFVTYAASGFGAKAGHDGAGRLQSGTPSSTHSRVEICPAHGRMSVSKPASCSGSGDRIGDQR